MKHCATCDHRQEEFCGLRDYDPTTGCRLWFPVAPMDMACKDYAAKPRKRSASMKPTTKGLAKSRIEKVFRDAKHQSDAVIGMYRLVYPDWDAIASVNGYPAVSDATGKCIFALAIAFDQKNHPDVMAGGCWMNHGFSTDPSIRDWRVRPAAVTYA
jgi:hypothetical protein